MNRLGVVIDTAHHAYLMTPLLDILLAYAEGINPYDTNLTSAAARAKKMLQVFV